MTPFRTSSTKSTDDCMLPQKDVDNIPSDSSAVIRTSGLLGEQYIDISIGAEMDSLKEGDTFYSTQSAMNLERLISNFASGR